MLVAFLLVFLIIFTPILVSVHFRNVIPKYFNYISALYHDFGVVKKSAVYKHLKDSRDLVTFFEKYRRVAGRAMGRELDKLILDMKIGNHELALRSFDARLAIPQLSALVSILCGVYQGVDQRTSLLILEQDIRTTERELTRREMEKRPGEHESSH